MKFFSFNKNKEVMPIERIACALEIIAGCLQTLVTEVEDSKQLQSRVIEENKAQLNNIPQLISTVLGMFQQPQQRQNFIKPSGESNNKGGILHG